MGMSNDLAKALALVAKDFSETMGNVQQYAMQLEAFQNVCEDVKVRDDEYGIRYRSPISVTREDLPKIRKAIGRVKVVYKAVPHDFEKTKEVVVQIKPLAKEFEKLTFQYRTKFRNGGKCRIVKQESTYTTIVCDA